MASAAEIKSFFFIVCGLIREESAGAFSSGADAIEARAVGGHLGGNLAAHGGEVGVGPEIAHLDLAGETEIGQRHAHGSGRGNGGVARENAEANRGAIRGADADVVEAAKALEARK